MGLPFIEISFKKPNLEVHEEVKNLMKKPPKPKKDELPKFWTIKERLIVGIILGATLLGSLFFWYQGTGELPQIEFKMPEFSLGGFGVNKTIIVE